MKYRLYFLDETPQAFFQTWPGGPGIYLTHAVYSSPVKRFYTLFSIAFVYTSNECLRGVFTIPLSDPIVTSRAGV